MEAWDMVEIDDDMKSIESTWEFKLKKFLGRLKKYGVSRGIKILLTNGEGPIRDTKLKLFNLGR